jgi:GH15 family glucan-1,4-alpha-glucosidase
MDDYTPIGGYGLIGNLETCTLVGQNGSIDWACFPYIDSPSLFDGVLDPEQGGHFSIRPVASFESEQQYMERTNILQTTFRTASGAATITDFMPVIDPDSNEPDVRALYRKVTCTDGTIDLEVEFEPRFDYTRAETTVESIEGGVIATGDNERVLLSGPDTLV